MARIAIIGAGISGLGAAAILHSSHDIKVFEKTAHIGGHARSIHLPIETASKLGKTTAVDTGFIVFNHRNYPHLTSMFNYLGVATEKSNMTFGVTADNGMLEWGAQNINALFGQRRNLFRPKFWRLLWDVLRFNAQAENVVKKHSGDSLEQLLNRMQMGDWFKKYYLLPMGGSIWSCSLETMLSFPASEFIRFFKSHGLLTITQQPQWYTVTGGSQAYVTKLIEPFKDKIALDQNQLQITRKNNLIEIRNANEEIQIFDHVIFACSGDNILPILTDATTEEQIILQSFKTQKNTAYLHNDISVMPKRKSCWSAWIYQTDDQKSEQTITITYWMNVLQSLDNEKPVFVTLNPIKPIASNKIYDQHKFSHPVYDTNTIKAQTELEALQGQNNTWFCGAWLKDGFHEDGLSSAVDVAKALGSKPPWV